MRTMTLGLSFLRFFAMIRFHDLGSASFGAVAASEFLPSGLFEDEEEKQGYEGEAEEHDH
jgi:hypothetical protein